MQMSTKSQMDWLLGALAIAAKLNQKKQAKIIRRNIDRLLAREYTEMKNEWYLQINGLA